MKNIILFLLIILLFTSCYLTSNVLTDKRINKKSITESNEVLITTVVDKYSRSKKWFYGTIEIYNKTNDTLEFNFKQGLVIQNVTIYPTWNIFPISYDPSVFEIKPKNIRTWTVAWTADITNIDFKSINIVPNTEMTKIKKNTIKYPSFIKDTIYIIERPSLIKGK